MSGGGSSAPSGNTTTVEKSDPWAGQQPSLLNLYSGANSLLQQGGPQYYPGQTLASPSPFTTQGINLEAARALNGSPVTTGAENVATNTLNGSYLDPSSNPYLQQTYDLAAGNLRSGIDGEFSGSGRYGSGAQAGALANGYANLGNQLFGGNYETERQRQQQTMALAPQFQSMDYTDIGNLQNAGQQGQALQQAQINDAIQRYNYNQNLPYANLANFANLISGSPGSSQTVTQPFFGGGSTAGLLGGAALGGLGTFGLGEAMGAPFGPLGIGIGAGIGGLLGNSLLS